MNREIKFRAWHDFANEMMTSDNPSDVLRWKDEGQPVEIMQFTGLKDKNGKEIWEGDKVKRRVAQFIGKDSYVDFTCEVRWNGWCYGLFIHDKQVWGLDPIVSREVEVIGNIYELNKSK